MMMYDDTGKADRPAQVWSRRLSGIDGVRQWDVTGAVTRFQLRDVHRLDWNKPRRIHHKDFEQEPQRPYHATASRNRLNQLHSRHAVSGWLICDIFQFCLLHVIFGIMIFVIISIFILRKLKFWKLLKRWKPVMLPALKTQKFITCVIVVNIPESQSFVRGCRGCKFSHTVWVNPPPPDTFQTVGNI